ncbi:hypothetical protein Patl1_36078 [Pistacia atlantica]|nr:hypothetical protein Patl1_36078 [Pistacia atlantica]
MSRLGDMAAFCVLCCGVKSHSVLAHCGCFRKTICSFSHNKVKRTHK